MYSHHGRQRTHQTVLRVKIRFGFLSLQRELVVSGLDLRGGGQRLIVGLVLGAPFLGHEVAADEVPEVDGEVAAQQRLAAGDGQQRRQQLAVELGLEHDEAAVHARAAQVGRVLGQVHLAQPLHHSEHRDTVNIIYGQNKLTCG